MVNINFNVEDVIEWIFDYNQIVQIIVWWKDYGNKKQNKTKHKLNCNGINNIIIWQRNFIPLCNYSLLVVNKLKIKIKKNKINYLINFWKKYMEVLVIS